MTFCGIVLRGQQMSVQLKHFRQRTELAAVWDVQSDRLVLRRVAIEDLDISQISPGGPTQLEE